MLRPSASSLRSLSCLALALALAPAASSPVLAAAHMLPDSTVIDRWTLPNGLKVVSRDVPRAGAVSITVGYRFGMDDDPEGRAGLAQTIGLIGFTAATADQPARQRADLDRLRPFGWSYPVLRHATLYSENVAPGELAGALAQIGQRMRGVRVSAADVNAAIPQIKRELAQQYFGDPAISLAFQVREIGRGLSDEVMVKRASGAGLEGLTQSEIQTQLQKLYVPANAVLSLAGDLHGSDVHALVTRAFGALPAGSARPDAPEATLKPAERVLRRKTQPAAMVGIIAPALSDSAHAVFYMGMLLFAGIADQTWGNKDQTRVARLQYGVFDEPELARVIPDVRAGERDFSRIDARMHDLAEVIRGAVIPNTSYDDMRASVTWLMGGAMTPEQARTIRGNPAMLMTLSRAQAGTGLRRGFEFWDGYRARIQNVRPGQPEAWLTTILNPARQVRVMAQPATP